MAWPDVIEQIESEIAEIQKVPNFNVEFGFGYVMGLISAAQKTDAITFDQYQNFHSRLSALHKQQITIMQRTGRDNVILLGDIQ